MFRHFWLRVSVVALRTEKTYIDISLKSLSHITFPPAAPYLRGREWTTAIFITIIKDGVRHTIFYHYQLSDDLVCQLSLEGYERWAHFSFVSSDLRCQVIE